MQGVADRYRDGKRMKERESAKWKGEIGRDGVTEME